MVDNLMMKTFVNRFNKKCPTETGVISIDGAEVISKDTIAIYISYIYDQTESEIKLQKQVLPNTMLVPLLQMIGEKQYKLMKKKNIVFLFGFYTNMGVHIVDVPISPEQYNRPIEEFMTEGVDKLDTMGIIQNTVNSIKQQLPIVNTDNGITMIDYYLEDSTLVSVNKIPDSFKEAVIDQIDSVSLENLFRMEVSQDPSAKSALSRDVSIKQIFTLENGDTLTILYFDNENIDTDFSKLVDTETRIKYSIDVTIHNIKWEIRNQNDSTDGIYHTDAYFKNKVLTFELKVPDNLLQDEYFDFEDIRNSILYVATNDELFTRFILKKGLTLKYIYKDEKDDVIEVITIVEKDVAKYQRQRYQNYQIMKY